MRLIDILRGEGTPIYALIGLVIAIVGFVGVVVYLLLRRNRATFNRGRMMPLDDDEAQTHRAREGQENGK